MTPGSYEARHGLNIFSRGSADLALAYMDRHRTMNQSHQAGWKSLLPGCFGIADLKFARHPLDEERAKTMIGAARREGASTADILLSIREFLASKHATEEHTENELLHAERFMD